MDEFHNVKNTGIEGSLKLMIDSFDSLNLDGKPRPPGHLIITGSHQQFILRMLRSDKPLYQRTLPLVRLRQWKVSTILEMAAEQNWLTHPGRFLTLWTVYGGIPCYWNRFAVDERFSRLNDFSTITDEHEWRLAFLKVEREILDEPEECFDSKAVVKLSEGLRDVLAWMALKPSLGVHFFDFLKEFRGNDGSKLHRALFDLEQHLELVTYTASIFGKKENQFGILLKITAYTNSTLSAIFLNR